MLRRPLLGVAAVLLCLGLTLVVTTAAGADTVKNTKTGETLKGRLTGQSINNRRIFKTETGQTKFLDMKEWELVEEEQPSATPARPATQPSAQPAAQPAAQPTTPTTPTAPVTASSHVRAFIIPIDCEIRHMCLIEALDRALGEAKDFKANLVIFRMNTPGGRVDIGDEIIKRIGDITWARTAAWVSGEDKRALSCGAYICLATHDIYMVPGATIGAATPFVVTVGNVEVEEKFQSAFRARFRSLAEQRGHPKAIADAMVDRRVEVLQVFVNGEQKIVKPDEADELEKKCKNSKDLAFERGKTVSRADEIITLTSTEAKEFGLCKDIAETEDALMKTIGGVIAVKQANWMPKWVEDTAKERLQEFETYRMAFRRFLSEAGYSSTVNARRDALQKCAKALMKIEQLNKNPYYDLRISQEEINSLKAELQAFYSTAGSP